MIEYKVKLIDLFGEDINIRQQIRQLFVIIKEHKDKELVIDFNGIKFISMNAVQEYIIKYKQLIHKGYIIKEIKGKILLKCLI